MSISIFNEYQKITDTLRVNNIYTFEETLKYAHDGYLNITYNNSFDRNNFTSNFKKYLDLLFCQNFNMYEEQVLLYQLFDVELTAATEQVICAHLNSPECFHNYPKLIKKLTDYYQIEPYNQYDLEQYQYIINKYYQLDCQNSGALSYEQLVIPTVSPSVKNQYKEYDNKSSNTQVDIINKYYAFRSELKPHNRVYFVNRDVSDKLGYDILSVNMYLNHAKLITVKSISNMITLTSEEYETMKNTAGNKADYYVICYGYINDALHIEKLIYNQENNTLVDIKRNLIYTLKEKDNQHIMIKNRSI